jgi:hypothetical protein
LASRRGTERDAVLDDTRGFFEQIGQFSMSRLWRQKEGTRSVYERGRNARRAPRRAPVESQRRSAADAYGVHFPEVRCCTTE